MTLVISDEASKIEGLMILRWLYLLMMVGLLSGCAMPAAFTVASFALDAGSYTMSGKTLSDNGLSLIMDEDCAVTRLLDEESEICQEQQGYEIAEGTLTPLPPDDDPEIGVNQDRKHYAQLAQQVHQTRTNRSHYLTSGMIESEI